MWDSSVDKKVNGLMVFAYVCIRVECVMHATVNSLLMILFFFNFRVCVCVCVCIRTYTRRSIIKINYRNMQALKARCLKVYLLE